jgi:hypothetical protein
MSSEEMDLIEKRKEMSKEAWIKNVMRIHPEKTREETEELWKKLFDTDQKLNRE